METAFHKKSNWASTQETAEFLGIHERSLKAMRRREDSPFEEGTHYRWKGMTTNSPLQWNVEKTEQVFTSFKRERSDSNETYGASNNKAKGK